MKLFVTDYDDTLYTSDISIKENIKRLNELRSKDFKVIIATGRSYPSIKTQVNLYQIPYDYLACADGSVIYDNQNNIVYYEYLDTKITNEFKEFYEKLNYEEIQFSYPEGYLNSLQEDNDKLLGINVCLSTKLYNQNIVNDFLKLKKKYPNYNYLCYTHPNFSYLCIKPQNIDTAYAITILQNKLNIKNNDIYVIGDSSNDTQMIKKYHGVGMNNSADEILKFVNKTYQEVHCYIEDILKDN